MLNGIFKQRVVEFVYGVGVVVDGVTVDTSSPTGPWAYSSPRGLLSATMDGIGPGCGGSGGGNSSGATMVGGGGGGGHGASIWAAQIPMKSKETITITPAAGGAGGAIGTAAVQPGTMTVATSTATYSFRGGLPGGAGAATSSGGAVGGIGGQSQVAGTGGAAGAVGASGGNGGVLVGSESAQVIYGGTRFAVGAGGGGGANATASTAGAGGGACGQTGDTLQAYANAVYGVSGAGNTTGSISRGGGGAGACALGFGQGGAGGAGGASGSNGNGLGGTGGGGGGGNGAGGNGLPSYTRITFSFMEQ